MALFLKGKFTGYYKAGQSDCVRDVWRFFQTDKNKLSFMVTRRDMESYFHRFQKYEHAGINLHPVDPNNPRLGGKVVANIKQFDVRTFSFGTKSYFGVYGEDFMTFGQFAADAHYPIDHEETLLKIMEDENEVVIDKHTFRFENNRVTYSRKVNGEVVDTEIEHAIEQSELTPNVDESWSESFFYGVGNKNM